MTLRKKRTRQAEAGRAEEQIKALESGIVKAYLRADTRSLETYYADDAVIIRRTGLMSTKAQDIEALKSGAVKFEILDDCEENIRIYGNVAVVNVVARAKGLIASQPIDSDFRETRIWVKLNGNWKLVLYQVTQVETAAMRARASGQN